MMMHVRRVLACAVVALASAGCGGSGDTQPPVATVSVAFNHPRAPLGSPIEVTYRFQVAPGAPAFDGNYRVMVHFMDRDEELMWTDDHDPPVPTSAWKPGQTIEYSRTLFVPIYPYVGEAPVHVGLYSAKDQRRLPLAGGEDAGQRAYRMAALHLLPQTENVFLMFKDGWHPAENAPDNSSIEWKWTKKTATIAFRNPKRDATFYLHADNPGSVFAEPQQVTLLVNDQVVETVSVTPRREILHKTALSAAQLGGGDMVELRLDVDKAYVPALLPAANSRDRRELGIRVFHAFVEPR